MLLQVTKYIIIPSICFLSGPDRVHQDSQSKQYSHQHKNRENCYHYSCYDLYWSRAILDRYKINKAIMSTSIHVYTYIYY